jgi:hypothetical protein
MAKYQVLVWTDPRLGGPHEHSRHRTKKDAEKAARQAKRENPTCDVSIRNEKSEDNAFDKHQRRAEAMVENMPDPIRKVFER